jgi:tRNA 2-thiouridine synthesizing protein A
LSIKTVDARGLFCPGPILVLEGVIKKINSGDKIELLADDPDAKKDVKEWCQKEGHKLENISEENNTIAIIVKKR